MPFGSDSEGGEGGTADGALSTGSVAATGFTMGLGLGLSGRGMVGVDAVAVFTVFAILAVAAGFDAPFFAAGLDGFSDDLAFLGGRASSAESSPASAALRLRLGAFSLPAAFVRFAVRPSSSAASLALRLVLLEAGLLGAFCRAFCTSARSFRRVSEFFVDLPPPPPSSPLFPSLSFSCDSLPFTKRHVFVGGALGPSSSLSSSPDSDAQSPPFTRRPDFLGAALGADFFARSLGTFFVISPLSTISSYCLMSFAFSFVLRTFHLQVPHFRASRRVRRGPMADCLDILLKVTPWGQLMRPTFFPWTSDGM